MQFPSVSPGKAPASPQDRSTLFHVTHWKAGSQWIFKILNALAPDRIIMPRTGEGQFLFDPIVPGAIYPTVYLTRERFEEIPLPAGSRRFVVLRDLRDTLVSAYFSIRYSHKLTWSGIADTRRRLDSLSIENGLLLLAETWLPASASIHASWLDSGEPIIRYEDLLQRDAQILEETLLGHARLDVAPEALRQAILANRFDALTQGRAAGDEDVRAHERKGIAGDWKNHFTDRVRRRVEELYGPLLPDRPAAARASTPSSGTVLQLTAEEILHGYDRVSVLTPNSPTANHWLGWEYAAFSRFARRGRILDLGCAGPDFFGLACPDAEEAVGVSANPAGTELARLSGCYREVIAVPDLAEMDLRESVDLVFSRATFIQIQRLPMALSAAWRSLRPGGSVLCSVVTPRYLEWAMLPRLFEWAGFGEAAATAKREFTDFHRIAHALPVDEWARHFRDAGFAVESRIPILPQFHAGLCLLLDGLWHRPAGAGAEFGNSMAAYLSARPAFRKSFRNVIAAMTELESDHEDTAGAVFLLRKPDR